jgi:hypothetical protein
MHHVCARRLFLAVLKCSYSHLHVSLTMYACMSRCGAVETVTLYAGGDTQVPDMDRPAGADTGKSLIVLTITVVHPLCNTNKFHIYIYVFMVTLVVALKDATRCATIVHCQVVFKLYRQTSLHSMSECTLPLLLLVLSTARLMLLKLSVSR